MLTWGVTNTMPCRESTLCCQALVWSCTGGCMAGMPGSSSRGRAKVAKSTSSKLMPSWPALLARSCTQREMGWQLAPGRVVPMITPTILCRPDMANTNNQVARWMVHAANSWLMAAWVALADISRSGRLWHGIMLDLVNSSKPRRISPILQRCPFLSLNCQLITRPLANR